MTGRDREIALQLEHSSTAQEHKLEHRSTAQEHKDGWVSLFPPEHRSTVRMVGFH